MIREYFKLLEYSARSLLLIHAAGRLVTLLFIGWHMQTADVTMHFTAAVLSIAVGALPYSFVDRDIFKTLYFSGAGIGFLSCFFAFIETALYGQMQLANYFFAFIQLFVAVSFLILAYGLHLWFELEIAE